MRSDPSGARAHNRPRYGSFDQPPEDPQYDSLADKMYLDDNSRKDFSRSASTDFLNGAQDASPLPSCLKYSKELAKAFLAHQAAFWCALGTTYMATDAFDVEMGAVVAVCLAPLVLLPYIFEESCWCMLAVHSIFLADVPINAHDNFNWGWHDIIIVYQSLGLAEAFLVGLGFGVLSGWARNRYHAWMIFGAVIAEVGAILTILVSYVVHRVQTPIQLSRHTAFKNDHADTPQSFGRGGFPG